jgi:sucrose phosphorylase
VKLLRAILDQVAPGILLITETNVPHDENIAYFGNGNNEAHLVYQFPLPPLTAHALITGNASYLTSWAQSLKPPSIYTSFFNFTASHDGIGLRPAAGILPESELKLLVDQTKTHGGRISSKTNSDGSSSPYELNITYFDLLNPSYDLEPQAIQVKRFLVSQAIMLALAGIPGVYIHNLLGSRNFLEGVFETGHFRTINREKLGLALLERELSDPTSVRQAVFSGYAHLLSRRIREKAFHPNGKQQILNLSDSIFSLLRTSPDESESILALHNVSNQQQTVKLNAKELRFLNKLPFRDILSNKTFSINQELIIGMSAYEILWLKIKQIN